MSEPSLRWLGLRIKVTAIELLSESDGEGVCLVVFARLGLALLEEEDRNIEWFGQLLRRNQPGATIMSDEWYVFLPAGVGTLLEQRKQTDFDALELSLGSNLDVVVVDDARLWKLDWEEVGAKNACFTECPKTGSGRSRGVVRNRRQCFGERVDTGGVEALISRCGTSEYRDSIGSNISTSCSSSRSTTTTTWLVATG